MRHGLLGRMRKAGGFTLVELMAAAAAACVLLTVGLPSVERYHSAGKRMEASMSLLSALQHARLDAVNRGTTVFVCGQSAATKQECDLSDSGHWNNGWMTFINADGGAQNVLATQDAIDSDLAVTANFGGKPIVSFNSMGSAGQNISFTICDQSGHGRGSQVNVSFSGQVSLREFSGCAGAA